MNRSCVPPGAGFTICVALLVSLACSTGCAAWNLHESFAWLPGVEDAPEIPSSVVAVWSPAVLEQANAVPTRGFGGRLMFYDRNEKPVRVEGTLVVYAFDEQRRGEVSTKADRKYVFTPEQFATHYSESKLGHSYSIWIPWDKAGGVQQQVSLIVRFTPTEGPSIVGSQTKLSLPGPSLLPPESESNVVHSSAEAPAGSGAAGPSIRPATHYGPIPPRRIGDDSGRRRRQMSTTTIRLPPKGR